MPDQLPADRVPAKSDAQARTRYLEFLQKSLSAVHAGAIWRVAPTGQAGIYSAFTVPEVVTLQGDREPIYLRATQSYEYDDHPDFPGERKVVTIQYVYTLAQDEDLRAELFSWQWHPGRWADPHLHVGTDRKLHVPTGRVAFEQVLLFAITDYGVETAKPTGEALADLNDSLRRFRTYRTWGD